MSTSYVLRDAVLSPLERLLKCALTHSALFETDEPKLARLVLPCQPPKPRAAPLLNFSEPERLRLLEAAEDGYAKVASPLVRLFARIPPLLAGRPFQLEVTFKDWQETETEGKFVPVDIGMLAVSVGGAEFSAETSKKLARDMVFYIDKHSGLNLSSDLQPWYFDAPPELEADVAAYQGILADCEPSAISRLEAVCAPVRAFLGGGGVLKAGGPLSEIATALGIAAPPAGRNQGAILRI
ncbi:MAG: hypothetical protein AAGK00_17450 [Pseudomonadota bacterium]